MAEANPPKVLVTGASGFIGSNAVKYFLAQGYQVRAMVRFSSNLKALSEFRDDPDFEVITADLTHFDSLRVALSGVDYVVHAAAMVAERLRARNDRQAGLVCLKLHVFTDVLIIAGDAVDPGVQLQLQRGLFQGL